MLASSSSQIAIAQAVFFGTAALPAWFILARHGKRGLLAWFFFLSFCTLRLVGGAMTAQAGSKGQYSATGALISQVGLSPLSFALTGIMHEASATVVQRSPSILGWPLQFIMHFVVATALPLVIVGGLNSAKPDQTPTQISAANSLIVAGASLFLVFFALLVLQAAVSFRQTRQVRAEKQLLVAAIATLPEYLLRVLYLFLGAVVDSSTWSTLGGGTLAEQVVLELIPEFVLTLILIAVGIKTRNLPVETRQLDL